MIDRETFSAQPVCKTPQDRHRTNRRLFSIAKITQKTNSNCHHVLPCRLGCVCVTNDPKCPPLRAKKQSVTTKFIRILWNQSKSKGRARSWAFIAGVSRMLTIGHFGFLQKFNHILWGSSCLLPAESSNRPTMKRSQRHMFEQMWADQ